MEQLEIRQTTNNRIEIQITHTKKNRKSNHYIQIPNTMKIEIQLMKGNETFAM